VTCPCFKCGSSGRIDKFRHIEHGICFQCAGTGKLFYRPRAEQAEPHPELVVSNDERATDKQWDYLTRLVNDDESAFCRLIRAAGGKLACQRYVSRSVISKAIEMARAEA
jgi:hypothetical protein